MDDHDEAIRTQQAAERLLAGYPLLIDTGKFGECAARFTEDGEFVDSGVVTAGRAARRELFEDGHARACGGTPRRTGDQNRGRGR